MLSVEVMRFKLQMWGSAGFLLKYSGDSANFNKINLTIIIYAATLLTSLYFIILQF